jgi:hypothetical protein
VRSGHALNLEMAQAIAAHANSQRWEGTVHA